MKIHYQSIFWADVVNTTCYVLNCVLVRPVLSHIKVFDCKCFILNNGKEELGKFNAKANEGIFLGYPTHSHAYRVYKKG